MKKFNTTAVCIPSKHYMVDLSERVAEIGRMVDAGEYFTINRARQYGKTTTIDALCQSLEHGNVVISLDFQDIEDGSFRSGGEFSKAFARIVLDASEFDGLVIPESIVERFQRLVEMPSDDVKMDDLFRAFRYWFKGESRPIVLIIDEVDTATNNQVFLDFLAQLRSLYLKREKNPRTKTFQSVILAGVTDVKHLRGRIRPEDAHKLNSPWNIAADFDVDMSLSEAGIKGMLDEYEADHRTGMDTAAIARQVRGYTSGYPYLVSRICELIDTKLVPGRFAGPSAAWTAYGVDEAVRMILAEESTLFESLMGKLENYPHLKGQLRRILLRGEVVTHLPDDEEQKQLRMYGFIVNDHNTVAIANRVFEMRLYQYFIGESQRNEDLRQAAAASRSTFVAEDGWLDVPKIMDHFIREHNRIHAGQSERFLEEEGRERFITYVAPIINGTGTYSIEEQTRDQKRMDLVIHYLGRRYVVELKIWHGERYNAKGERQIAEYLDRWGLTTGYMLSFNFNQRKKPGIARVQFGDKVLYEGTV